MRAHTSVAMVAEVDATAALLAEVAKPERALDAIARHVRTLEAEPLPATAGKWKRALGVDWRLEYAADEAAVAPFLSGPSPGPFAVVEGVLHRFKSAGEFASIEVKRNFGPFGGNSKVQLCGRWSLDGDRVRWKASYMINAQSREVDPPSSAGMNEGRVTHVSSNLLLLRVPADSADGLLVFSKVKLKDALEELKVDADDILVV